MQNLLAIHHASLLVQATDRALKFYSGVLGLDVDDSRPDLGYPGAWLTIGDQQLHLLELPNPDADADRPEHGGRDRHVALSVRSLSKIVSKLEDAGIQYTLSKSGRRALFCRDPDGNAIELIEVS